MPEKNGTSSFPEPPEWGESPKPPETRKTPDELKRESAKLIGEVGDASATNSDQKGNGSRPLLWDGQKGIVDSTTDMIAAEDEIEVMAEVATPEEQVSDSRGEVIKTVETTEETVRELEKDVPEAAETDLSAHATQLPASKPAPEEPIQLKKDVPQPKKESLEPSELDKMLGQEAWILGGIVSENRIMEDGSIIAKILIRKELQHWATESTKENSEDMDDYTGDHKAYYILALMTKTGEFLKFGGEHTNKVEAFKVDEWYPLMSNEMEFRSVSAMEENDIRKQA